MITAGSKWIVWKRRLLKLLSSFFAQTVWKWPGWRGVGYPHIKNLENLEFFWGWLVRTVWHTRLRWHRQSTVLAVYCITFTPWQIKTNACVVQKYAETVQVLESAQDCCALENTSWNVSGLRLRLFYFMCQNQPKPRRPRFEWSGWIFSIFCSACYAQGRAQVASSSPLLQSIITSTIFLSTFFRIKRWNEF